MTKTKMKKCSKCKKVLARTAFYKNYQSSDGLEPYCKSCCKRSVQISKTTCAVKRFNDTSALLDELSEDPEFKALLMSLEK